MSETADGAHEEFLTEAQDIIEAFSRNLLALDAAHKRGTTDPSLLNEAFRAIHTLKGLAGLFGAASLSALTHRLEDLLDALRLGRIALGPEVLDVLFASVEASHRLLAPDARDEEASLVVGHALELLDRVAERAVSRAPAGYDIDPGILAVLTEYEEHRLSANLSAGQRLYKVRAQFDLLTIDKELERLKDKARKLGEVITYLPTGESTSTDMLDLDLLVASGEDLATLVGELGSDTVFVEELQRASIAAVGAQPSGLSAHASLGFGAAPSRAAPSSPLASRIPSSHSDLAPTGSERPERQKEHAREQSMTRRAVRVDIRKLDRLMNVVGELSIIRGSIERAAHVVQDSHDRQLGRELRRLQRSLERRLEDLQDGILEMRMVPLGQVFDRLARGVRQISRDLGKDVRLVITGSETEIDKLIVEELGDPLLHMLRNSIDHGIESEAERRQAKKGAVGTIALNAYQKGNHVMIEVEDDGRGIDETRLVERAVQLGAIEKEAATELGRDELLGLIFLPGLSTRADVSEVSGRGVGMDVVKTNISRIGGVIDVQSERGIGTKLTLTLPITLAILRALLIRVGDQVVAMPLASVSEVVQFDGKSRRIDEREVMTLRGATLPLCRLGEFFDMAGGKEPTSRSFVVVAQVGERRLGLLVDELVGQQDIVLKALGRSLEAVRGFAGATELGEGRVALVLDAAAIVEEVLTLGETLRRAALHG